MPIRLFAFNYSTRENDGVWLVIVSVVPKAFPYYIIDEEYLLRIANSESNAINIITSRRRRRAHLMAKRHAERQTQLSDGPSTGREQCEYG